MDKPQKTMASELPRSRKQESLLRRIAPALGLFFLAPLTAEYLLGYDTSTGDSGVLLFGLLFLAPLYGGPALIIREVARRTRRGWPTMILLSLAFAVLQAGLIDHSLFNPSYRDIPSWQAELLPTYVPALGIGVYLTLEFLVGHVVWSYCVPIAIVETFVPERRTTPWLGKPGLIITVVLYLLAAALILLDHVQQEQFLPSAAQLAGATAIVIALVGAAFAIGRQPRRPVNRPAPNPWFVGTAAFALVRPLATIEVILSVLGLDASLVTSWWGAGLWLVSLTTLAVLVVRWSQCAGWGAAHRLALAGGALLANVLLAFLIVPLGDVNPYAKLIHNAVFALGAVVLLILAARMVRQMPAAAGDLSF